MPNLGIWFPAEGHGRQAHHLRPARTPPAWSRTPRTRANGKKLLDFMLSAKAQQQVSAIGGGFSARKDVKATDANAIALAKMMDGVEIFEPDWNDIDKNLQTYVEDWKTATGS